MRLRGSFTTCRVGEACQRALWEYFTPFFTRSRSEKRLRVPRTTLYAYIYPVRAAQEFTIVAKSMGLAL